jgi:hypothetical protein
VESRSRQATCGSKFPHTFAEDAAYHPLRFPRATTRPALMVLPQSAVFARRGTTFAFDTLRFVDTLRHGSSAIEIAVNLVLPLSNDGTLEVAPVRKPPLQFWIPIR